MTKFWNKVKSLMPSKRKIMQLYLALLFNANLKGFASGRIYSGETKIWCAPGINCYSCPGATGACPLGSFQGSFSAGHHSTIYYVAGILLLYAILFGRMICGWACPFGLIEELLYKIKSPKLKKSPVTRILSFFKYVVLVLFVFIVPITYAIRDLPLPSFCKYICPIGTIEGGLGLLSNKVNESYLSMLGPLFTWKFMLMISIVVGSIFIFRLFCRFICPLGGFYGLFNKFSMFGVKVDESKCTHCNLCIAHCKVDIRHVGDQECINCGECIDVCPTKAISWKGPKILLQANQIAADADEETKKKHNKKRNIVRITVAVALAALLIGNIVYYWQATPPLKPSTPTVPSSPTQELVEGNQPGNLCYGYDLPIITGAGVTDQTINPAKTGKVTVINFWGTWCGPCKAELPYFDELAEKYADSVTVIAVHSFLQKSEGPAYIADNYADSKIIFSEDYNKDAGYYATLGGTDTWPFTLILDERGVVVEVVTKSIHSFEELENLVKPAFESGKNDLVEGNQPGNLCYGYDLPIVTGAGVTDQTINPAKTGKVTVINFWGTWCGPCKAELPFFNEIASRYEDSVTVIAVHSFLQKSEGPAYIAANYADSKIVFSEDYNKDAGYYAAQGGSGTWPYTVILDENGIIVEIITKTIHSTEELEAYVKKALEG